METGITRARRPLTRVPGPLRDERAFTLIEVMLSLSILVVMIGLVLSALRLGQRSMEKGEKAMDEAALRRFVVSRLSSDVASMYPYVETSYGEKKTFLFSGKERELGFVTTYHAGSTGMPWGGASFVQYSVGEGGLSIKEKTVPFAPADIRQDDRSFDLGQGVSDVRFSYLGPGGWQSKWDTGASKRLPLAVRAIFTFKDGTAPLVVTVPVWASYDEGAGKSGGAGGNGDKT